MIVLLYFSDESPFTFSSYILITLFKAEAIIDAEGGDRVILMLHREAFVHKHTVYSAHGMNTVTVTGIEIFLFYRFSP